MTTESEFKLWGPVKQDRGRNVAAGLAMWEFLACLPGSPLPPLTRLISNSAVLVAGAFGFLGWHFHKHRKRL